MAAHESARHFSDAEPAQDVKDESHLRRLVQARMAAREHHAQQVIPDGLRFEELLERWRQSPLALQGIAQCGKAVRCSLPPQYVQRTVLGSRHQPGGGVARNAAERPHLECAAECFLHDILGEREVAHAEDARNGRGDPPRLAPKQMINRLDHMSYFITGRTSTRPPRSRIGHPLASSAASEMSRALIRL